jgi:PAS domain-containing protein
MKPFDLQHIGVFDLNFDTGEQYWSVELRRILRLSETGPVEFVSLLRNVHPDDRRALFAFRMEPFRGYFPRHQSIEFRVIDTDSTVRWIRVETGAAFRPESNNDVVRMIGLVIRIDQPTAGALRRVAPGVKTSKTTPVSLAA